MDRLDLDLDDPFGPHVRFWAAMVLVPAVLLRYARLRRRQTCRALATPGETVEAFDALGAACGPGAALSPVGAALIGATGVGLGYGLGLLLYVDATGATVDDPDPGGPYARPLGVLAGAIDRLARALGPRAIPWVSRAVGAAVWAAGSWAVVELGFRRVRAARSDPSVELDPFVALAFDTFLPLGIAVAVVAGAVSGLVAGLLVWAVLSGAADDDEDAKGTNGDAGG